MAHFELYSADGCTRESTLPKVPGKPPSKNMVWIPGGTFLMGSDRHYPEERPAHMVTVDGFWMDKYAVTNLEFKDFVEETGHITLAERPMDYETKQAWTRIRKHIKDTNQA